MSIGGDRKLNVYLVCSSGGHLAQLISLRPWWSQTDRTWVTFNTADARSQLQSERTIWAFHPTTRNLSNLLRNCALAFRTLRRDRPDIVVSDGAGVALPFFVIARMFGIHTAYIEVFDRIDSATLTARLCRPFTTIFCVQWDRQLELYPGSHNIGPLL